MKFQVLVLGTNAALPLKGKITSAQILNADDNLYLLDCGEGTQMKIEQYRIKRNRIKAVFISHLHGDHCYGLPGLLTSLSHHHRKTPLHIFGPAGIRNFVEVVLECSNAYLGFEIHIHETDTTQHSKIFEDQHIEVFTIPLVHRVPTCGYLIRQRIRGRNLKEDAIREYHLTIPQIKQAKKGEDIQTAMGIIPNAELTKDPQKPRSYAYCTDTVYHPEMIPLIKDVDVLYHETTYLDDLESEAAARMHSTISQAARIAVAANAGRLLAGHFSGRYADVRVFEQAGKALFANILAAEEGLVVDI